MLLSSWTAWHARGGQRGAAISAAFGRVVDEAGLLTPAERQSLTETLQAHEEATGNQVVVVTLKSLQDTSIEEYGYQLGRSWGIGQKQAATTACC